MPSLLGYTVFNFLPMALLLVFTYVVFRSHSNPSPTRSLTVISRNRLSCGRISHGKIRNHR